MYDLLGLLIGIINLVVVGNGGLLVICCVVLILYLYCVLKIGVFSQNLNLIELGVLMSGFVECIGDVVVLVFFDGFVYDLDFLLVEVLDVMVLIVGVDVSFLEIVIVVFVYWKFGVVYVLCNGLWMYVGFVCSGMVLCLVFDVIVVLIVVNLELGLFYGGVVGLFDFGGFVIYVILVEIKLDFRMLDFQFVSVMVWYQDFFGSQIDQVLLFWVID